jgi:prepilin peptidase CpaA
MGTKLSGTFSSVSSNLPEATACAETDFDPGGKLAGVFLLAGMNAPFTTRLHADALRSRAMIHALQTLLLVIFPVLVIVAALRDATSYTIPNWIPLALVAAFPVVALGVGLPLQTIGLQLALGLAALAVGMGMFAARWIGGGDAKLFAAAALWIGWPATMTFLGLTGLAGGVLAVSLLGLRSAYVRPYMPAGPAWLARLVEPGQNVPYGVAIAVGALAAFPASALVGRF